MTTCPLTRPPQAAGCGLRDGRGSRMNDGQHAGGSCVTVACRVQRGRAVHVQRGSRAVTISGKTADERTAEEGSYVLQEIRRGNSSRTVTLPTGLEPDKAKATFENGILRLEIPKAEQLKPRQIKISPVTDGNGPRTS